jgi:hypothetical protein
MQAVARQSAGFLRALVPGSAEAPLYPNYAIWDTPMDKMYGRNVGTLKEVKRKVDPEDVMGLAGGFKL